MGELTWYDKDLITKLSHSQELLAIWEFDNPDSKYKFYLSYFYSVLETFFLKRVKKVTGRGIILDLSLKEWGLNNITAIWRKGDRPF